MKKKNCARNVIVLIPGSVEKFRLWGSAETFDTQSVSALGVRAPLPGAFCNNPHGLVALSACFGVDLRPTILVRATHIGSLPDHLHPPPPSFQTCSLLCSVQNEN